LSNENYESEEPIGLQDILDSENFAKYDPVNLLYGIIYMSFGDFYMEPIRDEGPAYNFTFWFGVVLMTLIMLELLVSILGNRMSEILDTKEQTDYAALN
jgi:hypothetical protein